MDAFRAQRCALDDKKVEQIESAVYARTREKGATPFAYAMALARAIEKAHGITNPSRPDAGNTQE